MINLYFLKTYLKGNATQTTKISKKMVQLQQTSQSAQVLSTSL